MLPRFRVKWPSRGEALDLVGIGLSLCCLFIGTLYVASTRTGFAYWLAGTVLDVGPLPSPDPLVIRSILEMFGLHDYIRLRLGIGLVLVAVGGAGILVERPARAARSIWMVLGAYRKPAGPEREQAMSEVLRNRLSIAYANGATEKDLLLAGVFNIWLRSVILFCLLFAGVALAVYTYVRYSESSLAASLVKEKLTSYLHEVQLGYVPDRPRTRQTEISSLVDHLGALPNEMRVLRRTISLVQAMTIRASAADLEALEKDIGDAITDVKDGTDVRGYPVPEYDRFFYLSYLAAGLYRVLAETNLQPNRHIWDWSGTVLGAADSLLGAEPKLRALRPVFTRLRGLRLAQIVQSLEEWDRDPGIRQRMMEASDTLLMVTNQALTQEQLAREQLNSALLDCVPLRVVGCDRRRGSGFASRQREAGAILQNSDGEQRAARVVDRVLGATEQFERYFPGNRFAFLTRAEVYTAVCKYLVYLDSNRIMPGGCESELRDRLCQHAQAPSAWPTEPAGHMWRDSLKIACLTETALALDALDRPSPPWGKESVWLRIERDSTFCDGVFDILTKGGENGPARTAFERAGVRYRFGLE